MKRLAIALVAVLGLLAVLGAGSVLWLRSDGGKAWIAAEIGRRASTAGGAQVSVGRLSGDLFRRIDLADIAVRDPGGVWLAIGAVSVDWRPLDLLRGRLTLERVDVRDASLERLPQETRPAQRHTFAERLEALRVLSVIRIASVAVEDLTLGAPVLGEAAVLRASGHVETEAATVRGALSVRRIGGPAGSLEATGEYRAADDSLAMGATLSEPSGGLIARALDVPGLPALRAEAKGAGALSDWRGQASLSFGQAAAMQADIGIRRGTQTDFDVTGTATIPRADDGILRSLASGGHRFRAAGGYAPAGIVTISQFEWTAAAFELAGGGMLRLDGLAADAHATARTTGAATLPLSHDGTSIVGVTIEATASGVLPAPAVRLSVEAERLSVPALASGSLAGALDFRADTRERGRLEGSATLSSIDWTGGALAQSLLGRSLSLQFAAAVDDRRSELRVESARIVAAHGALSGSGRFGWASGDGAAKATVTLPDLAPVGAAAGMPLSGVVVLALDGALQGFGAAATAQLSGTAADVVPGNAVAEAVLARDATLDATLSLADGKIEAKNVVAKSGAAEARLDATLDTASRALAGSYRIAVAGGKTLAPADGIAVDCDCRATGRLGGTYGDPTIAGDIAAKSVRLRNLVFRTPAATYDVAKIADAPGGTFTLKTETPVGAITARMKAALETSRLRLGGLEAEGGSARLSGTLDVPLSEAPVVGDLKLEIADMKPWLAAAGLDGEGRSSAQVKLRARGKRQAIEGAATLDALQFRRAPGALPVSIAQATVEMAVTDLSAGEDNKVELRIGKGGIGDASFESIAATARGSPARAELSLAAKGNWNGPLTADLAAAYSNAAGRRSVDVTRFRGTLLGETASLERPLQMAWSDRGMTAETLALRFGDARVTGRLRAGKAEADLSLAAAGVPLKTIDRFWPLGLDGRADATLAFKGPLPEPDGTLSLRIPSLRFSGEPGSPALAVDLGGAWHGGRLAVNGKIDAGKGEPSVVEAAMPLRLEAPDWHVAMPREQPVSATLRWTGETATLWRFVPVSEHLLRGSGKIDVTLAGTLAMPTLDGSLAVANGYYESLEYGTVLRALDLAVALDGGHLRITRLTASDGGEGKLEGGGTVTLDPEAGFPFSATAQLAKLTAVRRDDVQASASGALKLSGTFRKAKVESELTTDQVEIRVLDRLPPEVAALDVVEVGGAGTLPAATQPDAAPPFDADLDVRIAMPRRVFVRGRGIESEWKGNMKVEGSASVPVVAGYLSLVRGQMTVVGKTFQMESGSFFLPENGNGEPEMSMTAVHTARGLTVRAQVEGPVSRPKIALSSTPALPQEEIVSQVLFNKSASKLSVYEAAQLGFALSELTGSGGAGGVLDFVRKTIGVDSLQVESTQTETGSTPVVGAGKYVTDDVYVGVKQGATPDSSSVGVEVELTPHIAVESEVKRSGQSDVGVKFKLDY